MAIRVFVYTGVLCSFIAEFGVKRGEGGEKEGDLLSRRVNCVLVYRLAPFVRFRGPIVVRRVLLLFLCVLHAVLGVPSIDNEV